MQGKKNKKTGISQTNNLNCKMCQTAKVCGEVNKPDRYNHEEYHIYTYTVIS